MKKARNSPLKDAFVQESLKIIADQGIKDLSIREVARRLGVSHGAPYRHFANRDALISEIAVRGMVLLRDYLNRDIDFSKRSARQNFTQFCSNYFLFAREQHDYFQLILWSDLPDTNEYPDLKVEADLLFSAGHDMVRAINRDEPGKIKNYKRAILHMLSTVHGCASLVSSGKLAVVGYRLGDLDNHFKSILDALYEALR